MRRVLNLEKILFKIMEQFTEDKLKMELWDMDTVFKSGLTVKDSKATGVSTKEMEKVD